MGARVLKPKTQLHPEILPRATAKAFWVFANDADWLSKSGWYLAGGTALALQVGHRTSVDLDFFSRKKEFDIASLEDQLARLGNWETTFGDSGTLYGKLFGAKCSFIAYPFFHPSTDKLRQGNVSLLKPDDIAIMKIIAVSQRGRKRDFVDLYWYCNYYKGSLDETFYRMLRQYPQRHNPAHILKSLTYFNDAEDDPMPRLHFDVEWPTVKAYFRREVPRITKKLLRL
jgi:Nucleotidyl transferase AbiEii toxin, Type IV TA system